MTLLIALTAAVVSTLVWYSNKNAREMKCGMLCYMFWGASLMWLVDAAVEYAEAGAEYFQPAAQDMINDSFLGLSVVALAMAVWVVYVLVKDPKNVLKELKKH